MTRTIMAGSFSALVTSTKRMRQSSGCQKWLGSMRRCWKSRIFHPAGARGVLQHQPFGSECRSPDKVHNEPLLPNIAMKELDVDKIHIWGVVGELLKAGEFPWARVRAWADSSDPL